MQLISSFEVNHRELIESLFKEAGYEIVTAGRSLTGNAPDGGTIEVSFDDLGRMTGMEGKLIPEVKPKKPWWKFW